jgi:dCTP deaminase
MTALTCDTIRDRLRAKDPKERLVVAPLLDPETQVKTGQAAVDVRLGRVFVLVKPWSQAVSDPFADPHQRDLNAEPPLEKVVLDFGESLVIHPHQFILARTLEFVRLPADLIAYVMGRSSWGRRGLIVATAAVVHPNFAGPITLELTNVGEVPIELHAFDRVAQLTFHSVIANQLSANPSGRSQFASTFAPTLGKVRDPATVAVIEKLARERNTDEKRGPSNG